NVTPELADAAWDLVRRDPHRPFEGPRTILPPAHVEHKRPLRDQSQRDLRVYPAADGPKRRTQVETTRRRTHQSRLTRGRASPGSASKSGSKITCAFCSCAHDTAPL